MVISCFRLLACLAILGAQESRIKSISFEDNRTFKDYTLRSVISLVPGEVYSEEMARADARSLVAFYESKGFKKTRVTTQYGRLWPRRLYFEIREGKGPTVNRIRFRGNRRVSGSRLANVLYTTRKTLYNPSMVASDSAEILRFYRNQGFPWAEVKPRYDRNRRKLVYRLQEGPRLKIKSVRIIGASASDENAILGKVPLKKKSPFTLLARQETERIARRYYKDRGYPYVVVSADTTTRGTQVELTLSVVPGKRAWISSIAFSGVNPNQVNPAFLLRTTRLKAGERYSAKRLDRANRLLYSTSLFSRVRMDLLSVASGREDSLDLDFQLTYAKPHAVLLGAGIQTGNTEDRAAYISGDSPLARILKAITPDRLFLSLGWEHLNLFRRGVTLSAEATITPTFSGDYETGFEIRNRYPNFLPWGLTLSLSPYWKHSRRQDSTTVFITHTLGGEAGFEKDFSDKLRVGISAQMKRGFQTPNDSSPELQTNFLRASLIYDSRDDFFNPKSGVFFFPYFDWAGKPFGGANHFVRASAEIRNYLELPFQSVLAWRLRGGIILPHSGMRPEDISLEEKFTLGGTGTVRAVWDKYLGPDTRILEKTEIITDEETGQVDTLYYELVERYGTLMLLNNIEVRTPYVLWNLIGFAFFVDIGLCTRGPDSKPEPNEEWVWGPGGGIRINTPIGPVRIDYAKNALQPYHLDLSDGLTPDDDIGRIEFGFLQAF